MSCLNGRPFISAMPNIRNKNGRHNRPKKLLIFQTFLQIGIDKSIALRYNKTMERR